MRDALEQLRTFVEQWQDGGEQNKIGFLLFKETLESMPSVSLDFIPRSGVTYSLRGKHSNQSDRPLFVMIDVIEGEPRWLSVCFYAEMISDPEERGDFVPGGLLGEDAVCFDMEEFAEEPARYLIARLNEACASAATVG
jgi:hypothetical protein